MKMQNVQKGFTLIELVVVIVLLGILGVTALAKFQDLSTEAQDAANAGVAAELSSGSSINYAAGSLGASGSVTTVGMDCVTVAANLLATGAPAGYNFPAGTPAVCGAAGTTMTCPVDDGGTAADALVLCI
jgi:MSHA pilin protein MshA